MKSVLEGPLPVSVDEVLDRLGVEYDGGRGDEVTGRCPDPAHDDNHPSASFNTSTGLWCCHACGAGGTLAWLVRTVTGTGIRAARWWLREVDSSRAPQHQEREVETYGEWLLAEYADVTNLALDCFGLTREAVDAYGIRWREERYGGKRKVYPDAFVFGIRDPASGKLWGTHLKWDGGAFTSSGCPKSRTLFGIERFRSGSPAILVESPLDAAVLLTAGLDGGLASFGTPVSRGQAALLSERASCVVLALDNDRAGRDGQKKLLRELAVPVWCFNYGDSTGKDPGELTPDELRDGLRYATALRRR